MISMHFTQLAILAFGAVFVNNIVVFRFLGLCSAFSAARKPGNSAIVGITVAVIMTLATLFAWPINAFFLVPLNLDHMQVLIFIIIVAALVELSELVILGISPALHVRLGMHLPSLIANCALLGGVLLSTGSGGKTGDIPGFVESLVTAASMGAGFVLIMVLIEGIQERLDLINVPAPFRGLPILLACAGFIALAFLGLTGIG
jgi:electron transport complex protein RnfA